MRVNWCIADTYQFDPAIDLDRVKSVGPIWGSWKTWRGCGTDNVICHDTTKARELIRRAFQAVCNFYVPKKNYQDLGRPMGLRLYDGDFSHDVDHAENIICLHLAASVSDIILMMGYDLSQIPDLEDRFEKHKLHNYHGMISSTIKNNPLVQWVLVDHPDKLALPYQDLPNLTCDTMENALQLLI